MGRKLFEMSAESGVGKANLEKDFIRSEDILILRNGLKQLKENERTLLLLYQDELSHAEIASVLNVKTSSVSKLLSRSLEKLSRILNEGGYFYESD